MADHAGPDRASPSDSSRAEGDQPSGEAYTRMIARLVFETLGKAKWGPSRSLIEKIIENPDSDPEILEAAVEAAGLLLADTADEPMLQSLENLLYGDAKCDLLPLALAIGRIDLERLFRQQSARTAGQALQQISAERDVMIFDPFWADRNGKVTQWRRPPVKVFHIVNVANRGLSDIFAHELSRWGLQFECEDLSECVAALIFEPATSDGLAELVIEAETLSARRSEFQLFPIRAGISDRKAKTMARRIGAALGRNEGRAPSRRRPA